MNVRPALLLRRADAVLTLRYRYGTADVYGLPGGNPDDGESLTETLVRELREELGIAVRVGGLLLLGEVLIPGKKSVLHAVFEGELLAGDPLPNPAETTALEAVWLPVADLDRRNLYPNVGAFVQNLPAEPYIGPVAQEWFG